MSTPCPKAGTFLGRLGRSTRGNVAAIMAIALIPLAGLVGGGMDIARLYLVKTRLQHACDAGALAGRKAMGGGQWSQSSYAPRAMAVRFFNANIADDAYGTSNMESSYSENAGKVTGTASAIVPMTLTRVVGFTQQKIEVTCEAEMRLPNTDVMFVLDVTGSMASPATSTDTQTKIQALRSAVKCFYEIVQKLDTDEVCVGGAPSGGLSDQVQVRFGFVPYSANVNVGRLLPANFLADRWTYQSREMDDEPVYGTFDRWVDKSGAPDTTGAGSYGASVTVETRTVTNSSNCKVSLFGVSEDEYTPTANPRRWPVSGSDTGSEWRAYTPAIHRDNFTELSGKICTLKYRERTIFRMALHDKATKSTPGAVAFPIWVYRPVEYDLRPLKNAYNMQSIDLPVGQFGASTTVTWSGCIEERKTVRASSYEPVPSGALDLDLESSPTSDISTQWKPLLGGAEFARYDTAGNWSVPEVRSFNSWTSSMTCVTPARRLGVWQDPNVFDDYVDSLTPNGNTYHDIGLIWGARLMWPTGIFRADNEFTPRGGEIQRHLIFMTDGDACTAVANYQAYGLSALDRRQTDPNVMPTDGCTTTGTLTQQVNARTQGVCTQVRNENITVWVIWFGASNPTIEKMLTRCATPGRYFAARNAASLQNTFREIADQISQLRVTQ